VRDGVYTEAQAARGQKTFDTLCILCHETKLWRDYWVSESVGDVFERIRLNMPEDSPGILTRDQVRDVMAYILKGNGYPAGAGDLPESLDALRQIRFESAAP
jgi:hypothetical protein